MRVACITHVQRQRPGLGGEKQVLHYGATLEFGRHSAIPHATTHMTMAEASIATSKCDALCVGVVTITHCPPCGGGSLRSNAKCALSDVELIAEQSCVVLPSQVYVEHESLRDLFRMIFSKHLGRGLHAPRNLVKNNVDVLYRLDLSRREPSSTPASLVVAQLATEGTTGCNCSCDRVGTEPSLSSACGNDLTSTDN